jgi:uncharacterized protein YbjT (DUF2867 family)
MGDDIYNPKEERRWRMYVIIGATGHIGGELSDILLRNGQKVRVIGRSMERLQPLAKRGAEAFAGDINDSQFLTRAFTGAQAVFTMVPPDPKTQNPAAHYEEAGKSMVKAIRSTGVRYVVNLSSLGADLPESTKLTKIFRDYEDLLNGLVTLNIVHLRCGFFMENLYSGIERIKKGIFGSDLRGDLKIPFIATRDIATEASKYLLKLDFSGIVTRELRGQRDLSMNEAASILGKAIGQPVLKYIQFSYEDTEKGMIGAGLSPAMARTLVDLARAINETMVYQKTLRTAESTTETSFERFAQTFVSMVKAAA